MALQRTFKNTKQGYVNPVEGEEEMQLSKEDIQELQRILVNYYQGRTSVASEASTITQLSTKLNELNRLPKEAVTPPAPVPTPPVASKEKKNEASK